VVSGTTSRERKLTLDFRFQISTTVNMCLTVKVEAVGTLFLKPIHRGGRSRLAGGGQFVLRRSKKASPFVIPLNPRLARTQSLLPVNGLSKTPDRHDSFTIEIS
jgi:hypothetical protein